jgi:hypothetical protein
VPTTAGDVGVTFNTVMDSLGFEVGLVDWYRVGVVKKVAPTKSPISTWDRPSTHCAVRSYSPGCRVVERSTAASFKIFLNGRSNGPLVEKAAEPVVRR